MDITLSEGTFDKVPDAPLTPEQAAELIDDLPDPVVWLSDDFTVAWANRAAAEVFGFDPGGAFGTLNIAERIHPDDIAVVAASAQTLANKDNGTLIEVRFLAGDGTWRRVELRGRQLRGQLGGAAVVVRDISDRRGWDLDGGDTELLRTVLDSTATPVFVCEADGTIRGATAALVRTLGWDRQSMLGAHLRLIVNADDHWRVDELFHPDGPLRRSADVRMTNRAGESRPFRLEVSDLRNDPSVSGFAVVAHDIGDLHATVSHLRNLSNQDPLTGLKNRSALLADLRERLLHRDEMIAVLFCDLDGFKQVNDQMGHQRGDEFLCEVASRLRGATSADDLVARLGGDEFVVVSSVRDLEQSERVAADVEAAVGAISQETFGSPLVTLSVGAVLVHPGGATAEEVLAAADAEMYRTKRRRKGIESLPTPSVIEQRA